MKVRLVQLYNRGREIAREKCRPIDGVEIDLDKDGKEKYDVALAIHESRIIGKLVRARVQNISLSGLLISGLEENHVNGSRGYYYQEWWCITLIGDTP